MNEIEEIVDKMEWTFAKSMKSTPHFYTVRKSEDDEDYKKLYNYIKDNCYIEYFYKKPFKYCDIGKYKYWFMSDDYNDSRIINRCDKEKRYGTFNS